MAWEQNGNAINANQWLGTRNPLPLMIRTNNSGQAVGAQPPLDDQEAMRITPFQPGAAPPQRGRVGIWTDAPNRALHVQGTEIHTGGPGAGYSFGNRETAAFVEIPANGERWVWCASRGAALLWSGTDKIAVTPAGNVGIGTPSPSQKLELNFGNILLPNAFGGTSGNLYFGAPTDTGQLGMRLFGGRVNPGPGEIHAGFIDVRTDDAADGLRIRVDTASGGTERLRVTSNNVIHRVPLFDASCDIRTKTNIQRLDRALDKLEHVRGVGFVWDESSWGRGVPGQPSIGVIAQEVEEVFPELVFSSGDEEGYKGVDYSGLTAALIEAAKELKADNEVLRSRIEALEQA